MKLRPWIRVLSLFAASGLLAADGLAQAVAPTPTSDKELQPETVKLEAFTVTGSNANGASYTLTATPQK